MQRKQILLTLAIITALLALLFLGLVASLANSNTLPQGTSVGGINLADKSVAQAKEILEKEAGPTGITLLSKRQKVAGEINRQARLAPVIKKLEKIEKDQGFFDRLLGKEERRSIPLRYRYNQKKLRSLYLELKRKSEISPRSAAVTFASQLKIRPGKVGKKLSPGSWQKTKREAFLGKSLVLLGQDAWRPALLSRDDVFRDSPVILVVDKAAFTLSLYKKGKLIKKYPIAIGQIGFETPSGSFRVVNKAIDPAWSVPEWGGELAGQVIPGGSADNPLINRWLGIVDGVGIHGTNDVYSLGSQASHGCIRMDPNQVIELYDRVPVNSRVIIT